MGGSGGGVGAGGIGRQSDSLQSEVQSCRGCEFKLRPPHENGKGTLLFPGSSSRRAMILPGGQPLDSGNPAFIYV